LALSFPFDHFAKFGRNVAVGNLHGGTLSCCGCSAADAWSSKQDQDSSAARGLQLRREARE
jgi:hypothetical protein